MTTNTTIEILSDDHAVLTKVGTDTRYEMKGGIASWIIAVYRHQLTHGQVLADTFLMGVIGGMQHVTLTQAVKTMEELRQRLEKRHE